MAVGAVDAGKAGFLDDDGPSRGEVAAAAVAEPAGVQSDVLVLGDGEFAFRAADVVAVKTIVGTQIVRRAETPTVSQEFVADFIVLDIGRELEGFAGTFRRGDKAEEFARFAPEIFGAAPLDVFQSTRGPVRDRGENGGRRGPANGFPK